MKTLTYKGYAATVEFDAEDEIFAGRIGGIHDIVGFHADTLPVLGSVSFEWSRYSRI